MNLFIYEAINRAASTIPEIDMSNPMIVASIIVMLLGIFFPFVMWFIRNFMRIIMKKNYTWLNAALKWFALAGFLVAILGLCLLLIPILSEAK
ncbi:MAG: hypothetical protein ACRC4M_02765 [Mycoplasma sp.]